MVSLLSIQPHHQQLNNMDSFDTGAGRNNEDFSARSRHMALTFGRQWTIFKDKITPHVAPRWIFSSFMLLFFMLRVIIGGGWFVICYALGIYYLNLLIDFLSPRIDPEFQAAQEDADPDSGPSLPTRVNDEFRPFVRRLPEFKFWYQGTKATLISLFLSMFDIFDLPVFWPILLLYFFVLTFLTLRRQIQHMYKHKYVPWTSGKTRYGQG